MSNGYQGEIQRILCGSDIAGQSKEVVTTPPPQEEDLHIIYNRPKEVTVHFQNRGERSQSKTINPHKDHNPQISIKNRFADAA